MRKTTENVRKHRDIKLSTNEAKRNYLVSEPNYQKNNKKTKQNSENLLTIEMNKIKQTHE